MIYVSPAVSGDEPAGQVQLGRSRDWSELKLGFYCPVKEVPATSGGLPPWDSSLARTLLARCLQTRKGGTPSFLRHEATLLISPGE